MGGEERPKKIIAGCQRCIREGEFQRGTSNLHELSQLERGRPVQRGGLFDWIKEHHDRFAGNHNRFDVYLESGEKIGVAGFGRQTGFVFWPKESVVRTRNTQHC